MLFEERLKSNRKCPEAARIFQLLLPNCDSPEILGYKKGWKMFVLSRDDFICAEIFRQESLTISERIENDFGRELGTIRGELKKIRVLTPSQYYFLI